MRIEKISDDKIRIFINLEDLMKKNIDIHSFMSNPIESQDLFLDILAMAEEKVGFETKNYSISIEALLMTYGDFVLTVTRDKKFPTSSKKHFQIKRKTVNSRQKFAVFAFDTFEDFVQFCISYKKSKFYKLNKYLKTSRLYEYNSTYYYVFEGNAIDFYDLKNLCGFLSEFSKFIFNSDIFARKLQEYGTLIIKSNCIGLINKNFVKS